MDININEIEVNMKHKNLHILTPDRGGEKKAREKQLIYEYPKGKAKIAAELRKLDKEQLIQLILE